MNINMKHIGDFRDVFYQCDLKYMNNQELNYSCFVAIKQVESNY